MHIGIKMMRMVMNSTPKIYLAVLMLAVVLAIQGAQRSEIEGVLSDAAKRLEVEYFHAIKGEDFGMATNKVIAQNSDVLTLESLRPRIDAHNAFYMDVQPGDHYALTYMSGRGTELALNGRPLGTIEGADFASALYAMWLEEKPMNKSFNRQLLESR
jgi:chalcone isomerase-like protein